MVVRFCYHSYENRPNNYWTSLSLITITYVILIIIIIIIIIIRRRRRRRRRIKKSLFNTHKKDLPYYRKITLHEIKMLEINANLMEKGFRMNKINAKEDVEFHNKGN